MYVLYEVRNVLVHVAKVPQTIFFFQFFLYYIIIYICCYDRSYYFAQNLVSHFLYRYRYFVICNLSFLSSYHSKAVACI